MHFEESYFEGEEREGFYIEPMMKRAWAAQLEVLETVDAICRRNNIEYFASGGTLLGAIRHGGYIPWDDDLDIEMKRLDYERFLKIAERELPGEYRIASPARDCEWNGPFARILNTSQIPLEGESLQQFHGFPWQAGVDIFPIDYLPVDKKQEDIMLKLYRTVVILAYDWEKGTVSEDKKMKDLREIENLCNMQFSPDRPYKQQLWILAERISAMYWDTFEEAKEVSMGYMLVNQPKYRIPASCYRQSKRVPFENTMIPIPIGYHQVLEACYGKDYMIPKQGGSDHEYPFYRQQQELVARLCKENGLKMPEYLWE